MQLTLRSSLAAGVAALGAGVIAAGATSAPAPVAVPQSASPDVELGALADLLPPPSVGSGALVGVGNAIAGGANLAVTPVVALRNALPPAPFVPQGVQLSLLTGAPNLGAGNTGGNFNIGVVNDGNFNIGSNNEGNFNIGTDNEGSFNIGFNNVDEAGPAQGSDLDNEAVANIGIDNNGDFNVGLNNTGSRNFGNNNIGALNFGSGNQGALNGGINNRGAGNVGIGNQGVANVGFFNTGSGNIGAFNTTNNNIGVANIGIRNPLGPAASSAVGNQAAAKQTNATAGAKKTADD
jgi:PPE-repeat protein